MFAWKDFKTGEIIGPYTGKYLTPAQAKKSKSKYIATAHSKDTPRSVDAKDSKTSFPTRYINDCRKRDVRAGRCQGVNAQYASDRSRRIWVEATKNIKAGEEITAPYGSGYWKGKKPKKVAVSTAEPPEGDFHGWPIDPTRSHWS